MENYLAFLLDFGDFFVMGINCLLPFLKNCTSRVSLRDFSGQTAAVDASCWLHKALVVSYQCYGTFRRYLEVLVKLIDLLDDFNITPVFVFDGSPLPAKFTENERRERIRREQSIKADELEQQGKTAEARKVKAQSARVRFEEIMGMIKVCRERGIEYVVSPYEADPQIAHLLESNLADFAVSEDSDLLAYGCSKVLFKMDFNGGADMIKLSKALDHLHMEITNFQTMCIVAGCDYLKNIRGIGIKRAKDILQ